MVRRDREEEGRESEEGRRERREGRRERQEGRFSLRFFLYLELSFSN
jgi:hypothetical protein